MISYDVTETSAFLSNFEWTKGKSSGLTPIASVAGKKGSECAASCSGDCQAFSYNKSDNMCNTYSKSDSSLIDNPAIDYFTRKSNKTGIIIGSVIGVVVLIGIIIGVVIYVKSKSKSNLEE